VGPRHGEIRTLRTKSSLKGHKFGTPGSFIRLLRLWGFLRAARRIFLSWLRTCNKSGTTTSGHTNVRHQATPERLTHIALDAVLFLQPNTLALALGTNHGDWQQGERSGRREAKALTAGWWGTLMFQ